MQRWGLSDSNLPPFIFAKPPQTERWVKRCRMTYANGNARRSAAYLTPAPADPAHGRSQVDGIGARAVGGGLLSGDRQHRAIRQRQARQVARQIPGVCRTASTCCSRVVTLAAMRLMGWDLYCRGLSRELPTIAKDFGPSFRQIRPGFLQAAVLLCASPSAGRLRGRSLMDWRT